MLKKIGIAFFVRGLGALAAFLMSAVMARTLPIQEAGYYFLGFTAISILMPINQLGSQNASLRYLGSAHADQDWENLQKTANATRLIVLLTGLTCMVLIWNGATFIAHNIWHKPEMESVLNKVSWVILFMSLSMLLAHHFQAIHYTVISITILSIVVPLGIAFLTIAIGFTTALQAMQGLQIIALANLLLAGLLWLYLTPENTFALPNLKPLLATCFPLWIISIMLILTTWGSHFIAASWASAEDIARLAVAQRTAMLVSFILIVVNMVTAPRFAALYHQKKLKAFKKLAIRTAQLMTAFAVPVIIILALTPELIMSLFGEEFRSSSHLLVILALGQLVNVITGSVGYLLNMTGHEKDMRNVVLISSPLAILLAITLTPLYGVTGAAIATAIGISIQNLGAVWMVKKRLGFNTLAIWQKV